MNKERKRKINQLAVACFAMLLFLAGCNTKSSETTSSESTTDIRKEIQLTDLTGQKIDLAQYEGKTIFLNFWATWCRPCIEEMPSIASAKKQFNESDIVFLFASDEEIKRIESFEKKNQLGLTYVQVANFNDLNIQALPTTYIINAHGELTFSETGYRKWDDATNLHLIQNIINNK